MKLKRIIKIFAEQVVPTASVGLVYLIKEVVVYSILADKINTLIVSPPSVGAKSTLARWLSEVAPDRFLLISGTGSITMAGVRDSIISVGNKKGLLFFDEVHRAPSQVRQLLFDLLQFHKVHIRKKLPTGRTYARDIYVNCNVIATLNPMNNPEKPDYWIRYGDVSLMRSQISLDMSLLRRFHILLAIPDYTDKEFYSIIATTNKEENKLEIAKEKIQQLINIVKDIEPKLNDIPEFVKIYLATLKHYDEQLILPVTPELKEGIVELAKAIARISVLLEPENYDKYKREGINIDETHFKLALDYYSRTLLPYASTELLKKLKTI